MRLAILSALLAVVTFQNLAAITSAVAVSESITATTETAGVLEKDRQLFYRSYKPKPKPKPKGKSKSSKSKPKPKPKPKPKSKSHGHVHHSYIYYTPAPTPLETITVIIPERCHCKRDFSDQMCAWCINGSDKCIDPACIDKCCYIKECKCDIYDQYVCEWCDKGSSKCPDQECASACCPYAGGGDSAKPKETGSNATEVTNPDNTTANTTAAPGVLDQPAAQEQAPTMATVSSYSLSSTIQNMPASFTYSFFAVLVGAALAGVVLSLRVRRKCCLS